MKADHIITVLMMVVPVLVACQGKPSLNKTNVKRVGSLIKVRPEYEERYIILHKHTFPDVLKQIHEANIRNYTIFLRDGMLFSYFEYIGEDYEGDMDKIGEDPTTQDWWKLTDPMQEPLDTRKEGEWWAEMEEVFHIGAIQKPSKETKRYGQLIQLRLEYEEEYKKIHANVWPGVLKQIQRSNIQNYSIFLKDGNLSAYFEYIGEDFKADMEKMAQDPETQRWWKITDPMQEKVPTADEDEWWANMREVFHTD